MNADNHETRDEYEDREEQHKYNLLLGEAQTLRELARKLETDLARVTAERDALLVDYSEAIALADRLMRERDALLAAANTVVLGYDTDKDNMLDHYVDSLRLAIAACAPPASGEVKP